MKNRLQSLKLPWDERKRLIAAGLACAAGLILALLLPLAFRAAPAAEPSAMMTADDRALLFAAWWYDGGEGVGAERVETPDAATENFCAARMAELTARCIDDQNLGEPDVTGSEYVTVTGEAGTLRLCRMWVQEKGDWQNWLDVCFDADTGLVYYLYLSRECLTNRSLYVRPDAERPTAETVAEALAADCGGTLRRFLSDDGGTGGTAIVVRADGTLCYTVGCTAYDALIDIRIGCV